MKPSHILKLVLTIFSLVIISVYILNTIKLNSQLSDVNDPCDCLKAYETAEKSFFGAHYVYGRIYFMSDYRLREYIQEECIYPLIEPENCSYFGDHCAQYMESKGYDCSDMKCGVKLGREVIRDIERNIELMNESMHTDNYTRKIEILNETMIEFKSADEIIYDVEHTGFKAFFKYYCK